MNNETYTFWKLIENYSIEIPIIQRDYVQGREKEKRVRENFLNAIYEKLKNNENLHLDFIYGVIKKDKFIPLDGQQRLTTLFLIHYFLALKENRFDEFRNHLGKGNIRFTYEIRESSREFCEKLINNKIELNSEKEISEIIKDENWFFSKWKQDPTISSMLVMLDEIKKIFQEDNLFDKLKYNITFSFLEPHKFNIKNENELYIKMNSRGKPLNEFENFKSYFTSFLDENDKIKFDNDWFDIFWKFKKDELEELKNKSNEKEAEEIIENKIFRAYLNFFKNITAFYDDKFNEVDIFKFDYKNYVGEITTILNCLMDFNDSIIYHLRPDKDFKIFRDFILINETEAEYGKRLRFYALMKFFIKIGKISPSNERLFMQWMRVSLNLINNTIYNKIDVFYRMKTLLDDLVTLLDYDFYDNLYKSNLSPTKQFKEEKQKAKLISQNCNLEKEFIEAEKNWYLDGKIGFLIEFAGGENNFNIKKFKEYRDKFISLWDFVKGDKNKQILLYQALFTKGNYLPKTGNNYTFCSFDTNLRAKSENWHKVFNSNKKKYLQRLLDDLNISNIENSLEQIKNNWLNNIDCEQIKNDFEKVFIYTLVKNSENIKYCKHLQIRYYKGGKEVYLLKKFQMNGTHVELYTYDLYTTILKDWKLHETSSREQPCIYKNIKNKNKTSKYEIDILWDFNNGRFFIEIFNKNKNKKDYLDKLIYILGKNFIRLDKGTYKYPVLRSNKYFDICEKKKLIDFVSDVIEKIKETT